MNWKIKEIRLAELGLAEKIVLTFYYFHIEKYFGIFELFIWCIYLNFFNLSVLPSVRNALVGKWFSLLLFKIDLCFFLWRYPFLKSIQYITYLDHQFVGHPTKDMCKYFKKLKKFLFLFKQLKICIFAISRF